MFLDKLFLPLHRKLTKSNNNKQTANIINQVRPAPTPAYVVANPYCNCGGAYPYSGCGNSCNC